VTAAPAQRRAGVSPGVRRVGASVADQAVVSGTNFLAALLVGRFAGLDELGYFSLGFTTLLFAAVFPQSLVSTPYLMLDSCRRGRALRRAGRDAVRWTAVLGLAGAALFTAGAVVSLVVGVAVWASLLAAVAAACPCVFFRDFVRRYLLAHLRMREVLAFDSLAAVSLAGGLGVLAAGDGLTAATAIATLGAAAGVTSAGWWLARRREFVAPRGRTMVAAVRWWRFGRWVLASEAALAVRMPALNWIVFAAAGVSATGVLAACHAVVRAVNPLFLGIVNVAEPTLVAARSAGGHAGLRRALVRVTGVMAVAMAPVGLGLMVWGGGVVTLAFGPQYAGWGGVFRVMLASMLCSTIGYPAASALRAAGRARADFGVRAAGLAVLLVAAGVLTPMLGVIGAAWSMLFSSGFALTARWVLYTRVAASGVAAATPRAPTRAHAA